MNGEAVRNDSAVLSKVWLRSSRNDFKASVPLSLYIYRERELAELD